ncbi:MAG: hypothetical protein ACRDZ3_21340 [Acidimicrobiia bacterium]
MSSLEDIDAELVAAQAAARRLTSLNRKIEQARETLKAERGKQRQLATVLADETDDVAALEGIGLRRWLASLAGSREERLAKEHHLAGDPAVTAVAARRARDVAGRLQQKLLAFDRELSDVAHGVLPLGTVDPPGACASPTTSSTGSSPTGWSRTASPGAGRP